MRKRLQVSTLTLAVLLAAPSQAQEYTNEEMRRGAEILYERFETQGDVGSLDTLLMNVTTSCHEFFGFEFPNPTERESALRARILLENPPADAFRFKIFEFLTTLLHARSGDTTNVSLNAAVEAARIEPSIRSEARRRFVGRARDHFYPLYVQCDGLSRDAVLSVIYVGNGGSMATIEQRFAAIFDEEFTE